MTIHYQDDAVTVLHGETPDQRRRRLNREKAQRHRARKRGEDVPLMPYGVRRGYRQTAEHIEKRTVRGENHPSWQGDAVSERGGRSRALRLYPDIGPCERCGAGKAERHHIDENTANNAPENIAIVCRRCHMELDGRLDRVRQTPYGGMA